MEYNYKKISESLLKGLPPRTTNVVERRFGLKSGERETLEAIGQSYGITRERVRQIEEEGLKSCREKSQKYGDVFKYFRETLKGFGEIKKEGALLSALGGEKNQNQIYFLLFLNDDFKRIQEDGNFHTLWTNSQESSKSARKAVELILNKLKSEKVLLDLDKLFNANKSETEKAAAKKMNKEFFASYLEISKDIQQNHEGQYGLKSWLEINPKGIKDKAYLVLKKEQKPLHFSEVASGIDAAFASSKRKAHLATVHNELIKDQRFVLVGRGMYALKEWGYFPGIVKDVIYKVLKESQVPMTKEEITEKVMKQRLVKPNTVLLNLQDKNLFVKNESGKYQVREA